MNQSVAWLKLSNNQDFLVPLLFLSLGVYETCMEFQPMYYREQT